jgi:hypothetical protein
VIASLCMCIVPGFAAVALSELVAYGERLVHDASSGATPQVQHDDGASEPRVREAQLLSIAGAAPAATSLLHTRTIDDAASCAADLTLVSSLVHRRRPERSLAAIRSVHGTRILRVGERVDAVQLIALRPRRAYLRDARGELCELPLSAKRMVAARPKRAVQH